MPIYHFFRVCYNTIGDKAGTGAVKGQIMRLVHKLYLNPEQGEEAMISEIGITAGEILNLLEKKQAPMSISQIKLQLDEPRDVIQMSLGWLIREHYVHVVKVNNEYLFCLPKEEVLSR